jgi:peptidoglycan/LPS O-acetylase OafA/YrhL
VQNTVDRKGDFRLDIQGLRAVAVLLVVLYHARFSIPHTLEVSGGFVGVDVFFVISGFVVGGALYRELMARGRIDAARFVTRRAKRLLPALGLALGVVAAISVFSVSLEYLEVTAVTALAATFFSANLWLWADSSNYFASDNSQNPLLHTWSLSVEEQFYILFLLALVTAIRLGSRRSGVTRSNQFFAVTGTLFLLSLAYSLTQISQDQTTAFYSPFARAWQFLLGVLLYLAVAKLNQTSNSRIAALTLWLGGFALIGYSAVYFSHDTVFPGFYALVPSLGAALVILSRAFAPEGIGARVLEMPPLVAVGNISYSWYLWHWPFIVFADFWWTGNDEVALGVAFLALIPAALSFFLIEQPFRSRNLRTTPQRAAFVTLSFLMPAALASSALLVNELAFQSLEVNEPFLAKIRVEQRQIQGNMSPLAAANGRLDFVIVGDSHAATFAQGLSAVADDRDQTVGVISQGKGCLLLKGPYTGTPDEDCSSWQQETLDTLISLNADTVILHGYATGRLTGFNRGAPYQYEITDQDGRQATTLVESLRLYELGLAEVVASLSNSGKRVVILTTLPDFSRTLPTSLPTAYQVFTSRFPRISEADIEIISLASAQERNRPLLQIEQRIASQHPGALSVDLSPYSCVDLLCKQWRDDVLVYSDKDHITSVEAFRLSTVLLDLLKESNVTETAQ